MTARLARASPLRTLGLALLESGYQEPAQHARWVRASFTRPDAVPTVLRERRGDPRLAGQLDLFAYGAELGERATSRALAPAAAGSLARAGLLERRRAAWRSRLTVGGHGDVFVVGDLERRGQRRDRVDGYTSAADLARRLAVPVGGGRLLDLGTGSGIHALLAARAGATAVGADLNARALRLAALSAELSGIEGVQWLQGSWYEPVAGQRFDRIVCVAPYVVSPDSEFTFRDGAPGEEHPVRTVAAGAPAHLERGGCALVMCCWGHGADEDWQRTPMRWLAPRGADVLLVRLSHADPAHYALEWNRPPMRTLGPAEHDRVMARWLAHYAREGFERISFGALYVRRRAAGGSGVGRLALDARGVPGERSGEQAGRALANLELLAAHRDDGALLALRLAIPEGQRVEQRLQYDGDRYRLRRAAVGQADGLDVRVTVTAQVLETIYRLDGRRTLADALGDAGRAGTTAVISAARELLGAGLLEVAR